MHILVLCKLDIQTNTKDNLLHTCILSVIHFDFRAMSVGNEDTVSFFRGDHTFSANNPTADLNDEKLLKKLLANIICTCCTVPELRGDYSFGEGGRPRMGKRKYAFADGARPRMGKRVPVEETDLLDRGKNGDLGSTGDFMTF